MKTIVFYVLLLILNLRIGVSQNIFTKIPTPSHTHEVDIFFSHDLPLKGSYFKTQMIEVQGGNNYNSLILMLKDKAQLVGADAVIITNKEGDYLAGVGIKYRRLDSTQTVSPRLNYSIDSLKLIKKISIIPIGNNYISGDVLFEMDGSFKTGQSTALINYFIDNVFQYDFKFLIEDKSQKWREFMDIYGRLSERKYFNNVTEYGFQSDKQKVVKINYVKLQNMIESITVNDKVADGEWKKEKLIPTIDNKGILTDLKVYWRDTIVRRQKLFYNNSGNIIMADWSKFEKGIEKPFLRVEYHYYKDVDLPK
jgi:hypothetical protein